jgi:hypothetical protein
MNAVVVVTSGLFAAWACASGLRLCRQWANSRVAAMVAAAGVSLEDPVDLEVNQWMTEEPALHPFMEAFVPLPAFHDGRTCTDHGVTLNVAVTLN